jgi:hypothetical protein
MMNRHFFFIVLCAFFFIISFSRCGSGGAKIPAFTKHVEVFGIHIYATANSPGDKLIHAANVLAEYLDNNEDGAPDNPLVVKALVEKKAILIMTRDAGEEWERIHPDLHYMFPGSVYHDNFADEAVPNAFADGKFDGLWEETLHLITRHGYGNAYPSVFGQTKGTEIALAVDSARGGHFEDIPRKYPEDAWYTYYDETCGYGCQVDEYIYWALTSMLNVQDFPGRAEEINNEWRLNTREKVKKHDPAIYALLTNPEYKFPTVIPHGDYTAKKFKIEECVLEVKVREDNYFPPKGRYPASVTFVTECQAPGGEGMKIAFTISGNSEYKGRKVCLVSGSKLMLNSEFFKIISGIKPEWKHSQSVNDIDFKSIEGQRVLVTTEPVTGSTGSVFPRIVKIEPWDK